MFLEILDVPLIPPEGEYVQLSVPSTCISVHHSAPHHTVTKYLFRTSYVSDTLLITKVVTVHRTDMVLALWHGKTEQ